MVLAPLATLKERAAAALGGAALLVGTGLARKPEGVSWDGLWGMSSSAASASQ